MYRKFLQLRYLESSDISKFFSLSRQVLDIEVKLYNILCICGYSIKLYLSNMDWCCFDAVDLGKNGVWIWFSSGKSVTYLHWNNGQPSKYKSSEHCALTFHLGRAKWHDAFCTSSYNFMCEKKINLWNFYSLFYVNRFTPMD